MKSKIHLMVMGLMLALFCSSSAQVPQMINYQGKLTNASGATVTDTLQVIFTIYADEAGTTPLWTETQPTVEVLKGVFNVLLGSVNPISYSVFDGTTRYLGVQVGGDPEITPRKPMVSVAYAMRAGAGGGGGGWVDEGTVVRLETSTDYVGIGTSSPNEQLEITGNLGLPATTATAGIIKVGTYRFIHSYGTANTFVGYNAGNLTMTGGYNAANGGGALSSNTTGYNNTANGVGALYSNTTGHNNTASGNNALLINTTGNCNTADGKDALGSNTTGHDNTANGFNALGSNTTGYGNTANGYMALLSDTAGYYNTADGYDALYSNTTGYWNTANGSFALFSNITGYSNTALGCAADVSSGDLHNSTAIGYSAQVDVSNKVRIGNALVTSIGGQVDWTTFSDGRYKKSTSQNVPGLAFISKLKPVTYTMDVEAIYAVLRPPRQLHEGLSQEDLMPSAEEIASKQAQSQIIYTGFIAQEVEQAAQELGYDFSGVDAPKSDKGMYGLRYAEFVVPLVKAVQEQQQLIQDLQKRIEELEKK